jgi:hypothetical protein
MVSAAKAHSTLLFIEQSGQSIYEQIGVVVLER